MMQFAEWVLFVSLQYLLVAAAAIGDTADTCRTYPTSDPCMPGGVWDPLLDRCSGYNGMPCYQCYSGDMCKEVVPVSQCPLTFGAGNPLYLVEYWLKTGMDPCASAKAHYRPSYQDPISTDTNIIFPLLYSSILKLHAITKNAVTDGYSVVSGIGATMVTYSAVVALAEKLLENCSRPDCPDHIDVFTQPPYYFDYAASFQHVKIVNWNPHADPASKWTVEIVTHPNNPDGMKRRPLVTDPERVIMDLVYYWPMYTDIDQTLDEPIMVFSSSKQDGLAGSRFGWGLVKDKNVAQRMMSIMHGIMLDVSVDIELRILNSMQAILSMPVGESGLLPFHEHGRKVISGRFQQLGDVINVIPGLTLTNSVNSTGAYAWIHCEGPPTCQEEFSKVNVTGIKGSLFGASDQGSFSLVLFFILVTVHLY